MLQNQSSSLEAEEQPLERQEEEEGKTHRKDDKAISEVAGAAGEERK